MRVSTAEARRIATKLKVIDKVDLERFRKGIEIEYREHKKALGYSLTKAGMIASDHLVSHPKMYS